MIHELKTWPEFFQPAWVGDKTFEIRINDRDFKERDEIILQEFDPANDERNGGVGSYTGREIRATIIYLTKHEQREGFVVFGFHPTYFSE